MEEIIKLKDTDLFVTYRMPGSKDYYLIKDEELLDPAYEFVIHPFDKLGSTPSVSIKTSQLIKNKSFDYRSNRICDISATDKDEYIQVASALIDEMKTTKLEKVVLSRIHHTSAIGCDIFHLFQNLTSAYPNAFIYLYNIPGEGTWMGATPEILMERDRDTIITVALAATQKAFDIFIEDVTWNKKEMEEQAIIQRYIEDHLNKTNHPFIKGKTHTVQAGNVFHLKTSYKIPNVHSTDELINQLHPGPAICGMPKTTAKQRIIKGESHDRRYYCGYLGMKTTDRTSLFINLRCMQVFKDQFALYVGGGLTEDSTAKSEWQETMTKSKTLASVIQKSYIYTHDD